jgi:hypothetical protein
MAVAVVAIRKRHFDSSVAKAFDEAEHGPQPDPLVVLELADLLKQTLPPRQPILAPIISEKSVSMIHAWRGIGKTKVAMGIAFAVATGGSFMRWKAPRPRAVLYGDGELPLQIVQERFGEISKAEGVVPADGMLRILTPDMQDGPMPCLATADGQMLVNEAIREDTALIIVDSISTLVRHTAAENDAESWGAVSQWALDHRRQGRAILFIHHSGKSGAQRGTSKREDILDLVLCLKRPVDYNESEGARFEVHFEKARTLWGEDVEAFDACLVNDPLGTQGWALRPIGDLEDERVLALWDQGMTVSDIVREVALHKSNVCRRLARAQAEDKLKRPYPSGKKAKAADA